MYVDTTVGCGGYEAGGDQEAEGNSNDEVRGKPGGCDRELLRGEFGLEEEGEDVSRGVLTSQPSK